MTRTTTDAEFLDLVLADEDLLRAEFEAIIAAAWQEPPPPPRRPAPSEPDDHPTPRAFVRPPRRTTAPASVPSLHEYYRQRSPPR
jgi:hypothetical protein